MGRDSLQLIRLIISNLYCLSTFMSTEARKSLGTIERTLLSVYLLCFAFDFKAEEGGNPIQYVIIGMGLFGAIVFIGCLSMRCPMVKLGPEQRRAGRLWWLFLVGSLIPFVIQDISFERYIRVAFPFVLCGLSMWMIALITKKGVQPAHIFQMLVFTGVIGAIWQVIYASTFLGVYLLVARY